MKIVFSNREQFNLAVDIVFSPATRLQSAGNLDVGYADMVFRFDDEWHGDRAVKRLGLAGIEDFSVVKA